MSFWSRKHDSDEVELDAAAKIESAEADGSERKDDGEKRPRKLKAWWCSRPRKAVAAVAIVIVLGVTTAGIGVAQRGPEIGGTVAMGSGGDQGSAESATSEDQQPDRQTDQQQQEQQATAQQDQSQTPSADQPDQSSSTPQDDHAAPSGGASGSAPASGSGGGSAPAPAHVHTWVPITEQRWVVDSPAWDGQQKVGEYIQCSCGATFNNVAEWTAHFKANPDGVHTYTVLSKYAPVHHEATGHYETVTVGYRCSGCGATK